MSHDSITPATSPRPRLIGRLVRLVLGFLCLYAVKEIFIMAPLVAVDPMAYFDSLAIMLLIATCVFNYVINIGFSRAWGRRPIRVLIAALGILAATGSILTGDPSTSLLGISMLLWLGYVYAHLGLSFILAALAATPGCELRALPDVIGKIRGQETKKHSCPVSFLTAIDRWERDWRQM